MNGAIRSLHPELVTLSLKNLYVVGSQLLGYDISVFAVSQRIARNVHLAGLILTH